MNNIYLHNLIRLMIYLTILSLLVCVNKFANEPLCQRTSLETFFLTKTVTDPNCCDAFRVFHLRFICMDECA